MGMWGGVHCQTMLGGVVEVGWSGQHWVGWLMLGRVVDIGWSG